MRAYVIISLVAIPLAAACASQPTELTDPPGKTGEVSQEEKYFNENVRPAFELSCAGCHASAEDHYAAPDFLGMSPEEYYDNLVARPDFVSCDVDNSILLLKGADPNHAGVSLAPSDAPKVHTWLEMEADARFGGVCSTPEPPDPPADTTAAGMTTEPPVEGPLTGARAMEMFGDCMSYEDWIATNMPNASNQNSSYNGNNVPCKSCHGNGNTGSNAMPEPNDTAKVMDAFQQFRRMYSSFNLYRWTVNETDGSFKDIVNSYRWRDKGVDGSDHPQYTLTAERVTALETFFQVTYDRWKIAVDTNTPCDPALGDPPTP